MVEWLWESTSEMEDNGSPAVGWALALQKLLTGARAQPCRGSSHLHLFLHTCENLVVTACARAFALGRGLPGWTLEDASPPVWWELAGPALWGTDRVRERPLCTRLLQFPLHHCLRATT